MAGLMEGKAGLVTGAASGIGRACAIRFAREGAKVVVADLERARDGGEETVETIREQGGEAEFVPCDVARSEDCAAAVDAVVERYGRLDYAHNNAGIGVHSSCTRPRTTTSTASSRSTCAGRSSA
jgi:NAD(P)-dependent dehydrogenase (short-subunit alcohol dehydrogenase family)